MHIFYISHTHPPEGAILENEGGMQRASMQLIGELNRRNDVELSLLTINVSGRGWVGLKALFFLIKQLFTLPAKVKNREPDVILFSSMVTASLAFFLRRKLDIPLVTINHGRDVKLKNSIYQRFVPKIFESLDGIISVSRATRQACIDRGMDPDKGVALGNGFNMDTLRIFPDKQASRKELKTKFGIDLDNRFMLLTVGRQVKRKGHEWFIRNVFPRLRKDLVFLAIGDGPEFEHIQQAADESGERDRIFLLGRQPDEVLKQSYAAADLFVMPNIPIEGDMEGFGIVLLEANMARTPAIASDLEGIKDVITDGKNGYRIPPLDDQSFANKINTILNNGLAELSEQTRMFVLSQFSWEHVAREYIEYISGVITEYSELQTLTIV